jgi:hypothetical protein
VRCGEVRRDEAKQGKGEVRGNEVRLGSLL